MAGYISWSPIRRLMKHNGALIVARDAVETSYSQLNTSNKRVCVVFLNNTLFKFLFFLS